MHSEEAEGSGFLGLPCCFSSWFVVLGWKRSKRSPCREGLALSVSLGSQLGALALASPMWCLGMLHGAPPAHHGEGSHRLHPFAAGTEGLWGSVERLHTWEKKIQEHCLGCSPMAGVPRMPQGRPAPLDPWHLCPDPTWGCRAAAKAASWSGGAG